jgi:hypothetical protein
VNVVSWRQPDCRRTLYHSEKPISHGIYETKRCQRVENIASAAPRGQVILRETGIFQALTQTSRGCESMRDLDKFSPGIPSSCPPSVSGRKYSVMSPKLRLSKTHVETHVIALKFKPVGNV